MDVDDLAAKTTRRTKAVEAVYLWGRSGNARELAEAASADGLALIEDACQAHGTRFGGRMLGSFGDAAALSFHHELLSRPVDQDLLGCVFLSLLAGSLDEFAVGEGRSGADQGDEVRGVDGAPAVLR